MNKDDNRSQLNALIIYFSATGNTEKVSRAILETLEEENVNAKLLKVQDVTKEELYDYDLIFLGAPSYSFLPAKPIIDLVGWNYTRNVVISSYVRQEYQGKML